MVDQPRPLDGLLHRPQVPPWGPDGPLMWGPNPFNSHAGWVDGWAWATDTGTAVRVPTDDPGDLQTTFQKVGRQVVEYMDAAREALEPAPWWQVTVRDLGQLGGIGRIVHLGLFDLDRVRQAALWVAEPRAAGLEELGDEDAAVLELGVLASTLELAASPDGRRILVVGEGGREALVAAMGEDPDRWYPIVDLPLERIAGAPWLPAERRQEIRAVPDSTAPAPEAGDDDLGANP